MSKIAAPLLTLLALCAAQTCGRADIVSELKSSQVFRSKAKYIKGDFVKVLDKCNAQAPTCTKHIDFQTVLLGTNGHIQSFFVLRDTSVDESHAFRVQLDLLPEGITVVVVRVPDSGSTGTPQMFEPEKFTRPFIKSAKMTRTTQNLKTIENFIKFFGGCGGNTEHRCTIG